MRPTTDEGGFRERTYLCQDGLSLYYRDYDGPGATRTAALCLGGLTRNSKDFHGLARRLSAAGHRVLCPDYRGRGRSQYDPDWRRYEPPTYLGDLRHLLAATGVHRVVIIGTSLGGLLAMGMAVAMPGAVAGAVLNDVGPVIEADGIRPIIDYLRDARTLPSFEAAAERMRTYFPGLPAETDEQWLTMARVSYREDPAGGVCFDFDPALVKPLIATQGKPLPDLWPLFMALRRVPVLTVRGVHSDILSEETFDEMARRMPHMERATVPGVGHAPNLGEPEAVHAIDALMATL